MEPGDRTPDGRTPDGWTPDRVDTQWWTRTGSGRYGGHLGLPDHGDALRPGHRPEAPPGRRRMRRSATGTAPQETTLPRARHRRDQTVVGDTSPSGRRLGALLSSDDFGLSVERAAKLHPLWGRTARGRCRMVAGGMEPVQEWRSISRVTRDGADDSMSDRAPRTGPVSRASSGPLATRRTVARWCRGLAVM
jgi:hypothetical protein